MHPTHPSSGFQRLTASPPRCDTTGTPTRECQRNVRFALESHWYAARSGSQGSQCKSVQILLVRRVSNNVVFTCLFLLLRVDLMGTPHIKQLFFFCFTCTFPIGTLCVRQCWLQLMIDVCLLLRAHPIGTPHVRQCWFQLMFVFFTC